MFRFILCGGISLVLLSSAIAQDQQKTFDLGGIRQAKATVTVSERDFVISVRMLPVHCFDAATNARLNREKARELAMWALAKNLSDKNAVEFYVSGAQVEKVGTEGKSYTLILRVPRKGVSLIQAGEKPSAKASGDRVAFSSALFSRKRDYLDTLDQLTNSVLADLQTVENKAKEEKDSDSLAIAADDIEKKWVKNLKALGQEIKDDLLLFTIDQEELNQAMEKQNGRVRESIHEAAKKLKTAKKKEKSQ